MSIGSGISATEFRIIHERISDCVNNGEKTRDSGFAKEEIENTLKHPVAVELVDSTPSKEQGKQYGYNSVAHLRISLHQMQRFSNFL